MSTRQDWNMIVTWAAVLWAGSLLLGVLVRTEVILGNWRMLSELVWLLLGVMFVRTFGDWIIRSHWTVVVARFLVISLGIIIVWWLLLMLASLALGGDSQVAVTGLSESMLQVVKVHGGYIQEAMRWMKEAIRLLIVGLIPVLGYKGYKTK